MHAYNPQIDNSPLIVGVCPHLCLKMKVTIALFLCYVCDEVRSQCYSDSGKYIYNTRLFYS